MSREYPYNVGGNTYPLWGGGLPLSCCLGVPMSSPGEVWGYPYPVGGGGIPCSLWEVQYPVWGGYPLYCPGVSPEGTWNQRLGYPRRDLGPETGVVQLRMDKQTENTTWTGVSPPPGNRRTHYAAGGTPFAITQADFPVVGGKAAGSCYHAATMSRR